MAAGGGLLHVVPLAAIAILVLNDHVLKSVIPGVLTGKVSDVAGLCFFPLFLQGVAELVSESLWQPRLRRRVLVVCAVATGAVFAAVKTTGAAALAYRYGLGALHGLSAGRVVPVLLVQDVSDLVALPFLLVAVWCGWSRGGPPFDFHADAQRHRPNTTRTDRGSAPTMTPGRLRQHTGAPSHRRYAPSLR